VADNQALQSTDLTPYSVVAPRDPRLAGGGGYIISGLYDVVPAKLGQVANLVTDASRLGRWSQHFSGVDVNVQVRAHRSFVLIAGLSAGQTIADNCDVRANLPELSTSATGTSTFGAGLLNSAVTPVSPYCRVSTGVLPQFRGLSTYTVPRIDLQLSAAFQSKPGAMLTANYAVPNGAIAAVLGRNLSGNAANATVNLIQPGTMYGDRVNQVDLRLAKALSLDRARLMVALEAYNALNSSAALTYNATFVPGGTWPLPTSILTPRLFKLTAELTF